MASFSHFCGISLILHSMDPLNLMLPLTVPVSNDISNYSTLVGSISVLNPASSFNIELVQHNKTNTTTLVNVHYKSSCSSDEILTEDPKKSFCSLQISQFMHAGLNYHGKNTLIKLATGSYLMYNINVSYINQGCLWLYLTHTADAYYTFIHSTINTTFNEYTDFLEYKFSITTLQGDFYVAYEAQDTNFSTEVSGKEVHYVFSSLHTPCLTPLSMENPTQCIFISSTSDEIDVVAHKEVSVSSEQPLFSDAAAYLILIISLVILVIAVIVMIIGIPTVTTLFCDKNCELLHNIPTSLYIIIQCL